MAKDPAFLFYTKDFYEGTRMMLPEERACLIDLLIYQHQNGGFIPNDIKRLSMYCSGISEAMLQAVLQAKFKLCEKGWYSQKLNDVINERNSFSEKQSKNGKIGQFFKKAKSILNKKDYENLMQVFENQSKDEILNIIKDKKVDEAMLQAMLKHLAIADAIAIEDEDEVEVEVEIEKRGVGKKTQLDHEIDEVLNHFIAVTGKQIEIDRESNRKFVKARLKDKIPIEYLKKIIDIKTFKWKDDPKMREYIRIETLFNETKCNSYLTEVRDLEANPELIKKTYDYVKFGIKGQSEMALRKEQLLRGI